MGHRVRTEDETGRSLSRRSLILSCAGLAAFLTLPPRRASAIEQRDDVDFLRDAYNEAFFNRLNESYRLGAAMHFFHSKRHDPLLQTPLAEHARYGRLLNGQSLDTLTRLPRTEPTMEYYSELTDRTMHTLFLAIDWTHMHHEQTYDIMADPRIAWPDKKRWTDRAVRYCLAMQTEGLPRSPAPLGVTMHRVAVMVRSSRTIAGPPTVPVIEAERGKARGQGPSAGCSRWPSARGRPVRPVLHQGLPRTRSIGFPCAWRRRARCGPRRGWCRQRRASGPGGRCGARRAGLR